MAFLVKGIKDTVETVGKVVEKGVEKVEDTIHAAVDPLEDHLEDLVHCVNSLFGKSGEWVVDTSQGILSGLDPLGVLVVKSVESAVHHFQKVDQQLGDLLQKVLCLPLKKMLLPQGLLLLRRVVSKVVATLKSKLNTALYEWIQDASALCKVTKDTYPLSPKDDGTIAYPLLPPFTNIAFGGDDWKRTLASVIVVLQQLWAFPQVVRIFVNAVNVGFNSAGIKVVSQVGADTDNSNSTDASQQQGETLYHFLGKLRSLGGNAEFALPKNVGEVAKDFAEATFELFPNWKSPILSYCAAIEKFKKASYGEYTTLKQFVGEVVKAYTYRTLDALQTPLRNAGENWLFSDEEFGRQRLGGINPTALAKFPSKDFDSFFASPKELSSNTLRLLQEANQKGTLFYTNYRKLVEGIPSWCKTTARDADYELIPNRVNLFARECVGFFHVDTTSKKLMPLCIQLEKDGAFFDHDSSKNAFGWLFAKIIHNNVDTMLHESSTHLGLTHLIQETITVGVYRVLPSHHFLRQLLTPHLVHTPLINFAARNTLVAPGGTFDKAFSAGRIGCFALVSQHYRLTEWMKLTSLDYITKNQVGTDSLPDESLDFPYRQDTLPLARWFEQMFAALINAHYNSDDSAVANDRHLQDFVKACNEQISVGNNENPSDLFDSSNMGGSSTTRFPSSITTCNDLIQLCAGIAFTGSVQHNAINSPQMDHYCFVPNSPSALISPDSQGTLPSSQSSVTAQTIADALPWGPVALEALQTVALLVTENPLVLLRNGVFCEVGWLADVYQFSSSSTNLSAIVQRSQDALLAVQQQISENSAARTRRYFEQKGKAPAPSTVTYPYVSPDLVNFTVQI